MFLSRFNMLQNLRHPAVRCLLFLIILMRSFCTLSACVYFIGERRIIGDAVKGSNFQVFRSNINDETMSVLVNKSDLCREAPLESLRSTNAHENPQLCSNLFLSLLTCGANVNNTQRTYQ